MPAWRREISEISSQMSSTEVSCRSAPRRKASSAAIIQSGRAVPGAVTFWLTTEMRPSMLVVVPSTSVNPAAGSTMSAASDRGVREGVDGDDRAGAGDAAGGQLAVGEVRQRVGAEQDERVDLAVGGGGQDAGGVEAGLGGHGAARSGRTSRAPSSSATRPGSRPGARPRSMAPWTLPRRRPERNVVSGKASSSAAAAATTASGLSATEPRPSRTVNGPAASWSRTAARSPSPAMIWATSSLTAPGRGAQRVGGQLGERRGHRGQLDDGGLVAGDGVADAQEQDRQLVLGVGADDQQGAAGGAGLVDGGLGQRRHHGGREAVAELGVDGVGADDALGQLGPGVGGLVGEAGAADDRGAGGAAAVEAGLEGPGGGR